MTNLQIVTILLVEDDAGHARLIEKNLRRANLSNELFVVNDGQQALTFVQNHGQKPLLILLDLNLPVLDGYQVLSHLKSSDLTRHIPVIVLTTTDDAQEITKCYELGCNIYVTKPVDYAQFSEAIRQLGLFLAVVAIPEPVKVPNRG